MKILLSFITGMVLGAVFSILHLPIPAPDKLEGVVGVVGIFVGYLIAKMVR